MIDAPRPKCYSEPETSVLGLHVFDGNRLRWPISLLAWGHSRRERAGSILRATFLWEAPRVLSIARTVCVGGSSRGGMITRNLRFTTPIHGPAELIFDLIADMPNYGRWLPNSSAFGGTANVTPYPVRLGTTYLDAGPIQKPGSVTEFERPRRISFRHTVQIRRRPLRTDVDAQIRYTLDANDGGTFVDRKLVLTFDLHGFSLLALPFLLYGFRKENNRTLSALKRYVEG
jgi:uncharacterized protein YndB with AHSA1/START domain